MKQPTGFWSSCRLLLQYKRRLAIALTGAAIAAGSFGAGIGMILPASYLVLEQGKGLRGLLEERLLNSDQPILRSLGRLVEPVIPVDPFEGFALIIAASIVLSLVSLAGQLLHGQTLLRLLNRIMRQQQDRLFARIIAAPPTVLWKSGPQELISRMTTDLAVVQAGYAVVLGKGVQKILVGAVSLGMACLLNWKLTLITLVVGPVVLLLMRLVGARLRLRYDELQNHRARMQGRLHESMNHFDMLKLYGAERTERRRMRRLTRQLEQRKSRMLSTGILLGPAIEVLTMVVFAAVAAIAGWLVLRANVSPMELLAVLALLAVAGRSLQVVVSMQSQINLSQQAWRRMAEIDALPVEAADDHARPRLPRHQKSIRFEHVSYTYPGANHPAVDDVCLDVPFGSTVAIVGANGSGKTTLLSLLTRTMELTAGRILIDDHDIAGVKIRSLREQVAVVPQHPVIFADTIGANLTYGLTQVAGEDLAAAVRIARVDAIIARFAKGYDRMISPIGNRLSGGERQRLCLARAILRKPAILILDEATSQIDGESEEKINEALNDIRIGRTTFIIAHRLTTFLTADLIIVLDHGRVVAQGTHETLLEQSEHYNHLTRSQLRLAQREPAAV